jgi:SAM-dependent methyltransferase
MRYVEREEMIIDAARSRKVLHLGCIGFTDLELSDRIRLAKKSLHWSLSQVATVTGVDYSEAVVNEYRRLGIFTNIVVGDVERLNELRIDEKFDIILSGDIIEHISNPGLMLEGIKRFCHPHTKVILTTPHAFGLMNYLRFALNKFREGAEHVMTFNWQNIKNLLERHEYAIDDICTCYQAYAKRYRIMFRLGKAFFERFPKFGGTLFVVAKPNWQIFDGQDSQST